MNDKIAVGDHVAWADVPDGAMGRTTLDSGPYYVVRSKDSGQWLTKWRRGRKWPWGGGRGAFARTESVTIIALGLSGQESADDLRRLAEVFEIREALWKTVDAYAAGWGDVWEQAEQWLAERLHAAGWRAGMSAEDAARLLAERA